MIKQFTTYLGYGFLFCVLFGAGFYFGYKTSDSKNIGDFRATKTDIQAIAQTSESVTKNTPEVKEVDGLVFMTPGKKPECPETHKIKGKYDKSTGYFYAPSNKSYEKVVPLICFANEDVAVSKGFLKKY
jgi:hypothetical protein